MLKKEEDFEKAIESLSDNIMQQKDRDRARMFTTSLLHETKLKINSLLEQYAISMKSNVYKQKVLKYLRSEDLRRISIAAVMIKLYSEQPVQKLQMPFISEIVTYYLKAAKLVKDPCLSSYVSEIYGILIKISPMGIVTKFEKDSKMLISDLTINYQKKNSEERITIYNLLYQLIKNENYIVFKEIRKAGSISLFKKVLNEKGATQTASLNFLKEFVIEVCRQERDEQKNYFLSLLNDVIQELIGVKQNVSIDYLRGVLSLVKYLFSYLDKSVFEDDYVTLVKQLLTICSGFILQKQNNLFALYMEVIPTVAGYKPILFYDNFLEGVIADLLSIVGKLKFNNSESVFECLKETLSLYKKDRVIERKSFDVLCVIKDIVIKMTPKSSGKIGSEMLECLIVALKKISSFGELTPIEINAFIDNLLIYALGPKTMHIIKLMRKLRDKHFSNFIDKKIWLTVSIVLRIEYRSIEENEIFNYKEEESEEYSEEELDYEEERQRYMETIKDSLLNIMETKNRNNAQINPFSKVFVEKYLKEFKKKFETFLGSNPDHFSCEQKISTALEILATYDFNNILYERKTHFIKDTVLKYLESPSSELRNKAAKIVFHLSSEENPKFKNTLSLSNKVIQGIINKLLIIAVNDPILGVRENTLSTLNSLSNRLNQYLVSEENIKRLVLCLYDSDFAVQKQSICLFQKLIPYSPEVIPKIEQLIFKTISFLSSSQKTVSQQEINYVMSISLLSKYSPFLIEGKTLVIYDILDNILNNCYHYRSFNMSESDIYEQMIKTILISFKNFFYLQNGIPLRFFKRVSIFCINIIENNDYPLIEPAMKCLTSLVSNTGYQVILLCRYDIYTLVFELLHKNISRKIKLSIMKFLGAFGAFNPLYVKRMDKIRSKRKIAMDFSIDDVNEDIIKIHKKPLNMQTSMVVNEANLLDKNKYIKQFNIFRRNVSILQNHLNDEMYIPYEIKQNKTIIDIEDKRLKDYKIYADKKAEYNGTKKQEFKIHNFESLLYFVCEHTLGVLFNLLKQIEDEEIMGYVFDAIEMVIKNLGRDIYKFKDIVFGNLLLFKPKTIDVKLAVFTNMRFFIFASGFEFSNETEYLDELLELLTANVKNETLQPNIFEILLILLDYPKSSLRHKLKDIICSILSILMENPYTHNADQIFKIIYKLDNEDYTYHIMPVFTELINKAIQPVSINKKTPANIIRNIIAYFERSLNFSPMGHYFSNIIRFCTDFLEGIEKGSPDFEEYFCLKEKIKEFLVRLITVLKDKCFIHLPLMNQYLKDDPRYVQIIKSIKEKGYFEIDVQLPEIEITKPPKAAFQPASASRSLKKNGIRELDFQTHEQLKSIFDVSNNYKHDDWENWFNKLKVDLIMYSPSTVLIACKELTCLQNVVKELFKPAFAIVWSQFNETEKTDILRNFDIIISNPTKISIQVLKEILELIEFMSHDNTEGLNLDVSKLADLAIKCLTLPKAIYFKELEFQHNPEKAIEGLVSLYSQTNFKAAAEGLIKYAQKEFKMSVKVKWIEALGTWNKELLESKGFTEKESNESLKNQIKLHSALSQWNFVKQKVLDIVKKADPDNLKKKKDLNFENVSEETKKLIGTYFCKASFHLKEWKPLEVYKDYIEDPFEKEFYKCVVLINKQKYKDARLCVDSMSNIFMKEINTFDDYRGSYNKLVKLQQIAEISEIIKLESRFEEMDQNEVYSFMLGDDKLKRVKNNYRTNLLRVWQDRLDCMEPNIRHYEEILAIRSLYCTNDELLKSKLKLAKLCFNKDRLPLYKQIFKKLKDQSSELDPEKLKLLKIAIKESEYKTGEMSAQSVMEYITKLLKENDVDNEFMGLFFKKVGKWFLNTDISTVDKGAMLDVVIDVLDKSKKFSKNDFKVHHYFGFANYKALQNYTEPLSSLQNNKKALYYINNSLDGFITSISIKMNKMRKFVIQDLLRILDIWFKYGSMPEIEPKIKLAIETVAKKDWLLVVGQIIAHLDESNTQIRQLIKDLLTSLADEYPQTLIFPLLIARRSKKKLRSRLAYKIIDYIEKQNKALKEEATILADELIRVSVLLEEQWYNGINEAWKYVTENNIDMMIKVLNTLHNNLTKAKKSLNEESFYQQYAGTLFMAKEQIDQYMKYQNEHFFIQAWNLYAEFYHKMEKRLENFSHIYLENVSPLLLNFNNSQLIVPGTKKDVKILKIHSVFTVLKSKRKPRKFSMIGTDGKVYNFLLKGNEDLRQDERVMQFLTLVNDLLINNVSIDTASLKIRTFNVLPISVNTGLISWLNDCETLSQSIRSYRELFNIFVDSERRLVNSYFHNYDILSKIRKVEIYRFVCENTRAEDLKKLLWLKSTSAEFWLIHRTNYIRSLAVMSMVGYILGLGDRHLSNLMLENTTGKIVHIDFGDCFETASRREKLPEKVPFRLTRVLVNAMEAYGIEGTFKKTCEIVMAILRDNKESLTAVLEEFVRDPLITWRMHADELPVKEKNEKGLDPLQEKDLKIAESLIDIKPVASFQNDSFAAEGAVAMEEKQKYAQINKNDNREKLNQKALEAIKRIKNKLNGKDFIELKKLSPKEQVKELIKQALSHENLSQAYSGWNPFL